MKPRIMHLLVMMAIPAVTSYCQGTFQNLDFELANIPPGQVPGPVSDAAAIPGWIAYLGTQPSAVFYDLPSAGAAQVTLLDAPASIEGSFSVLLQGGLGNSPGSPGGVAPTEASIRQTGLVPVGAQSIFLKAQAGFIPLSVSLAGQNIPIFAVGTGPNYTLYGGDVSAFGGQPAELRFTALPSNDNWLIDSIEFSSQAVPEPGFLGLFGLGAVAL